MFAKTWTSLLLLSSIGLAVASFCITNDIVDGVLIYIAQCLLFAASVINVPYIDIISKHLQHVNNKQNSESTNNPVTNNRSN